MSGVADVECFSLSCVRYRLCRVFQVSGITGVRCHRCWMLGCRMSQVLGVSGVGVLVCWCVFMCWCVGVLVCRSVGVLVCLRCWCVGVLIVLVYPYFCFYFSLIFSLNRYIRIFSLGTVHISVTWCFPYIFASILSFSLKIANVAFFPLGAVCIDRIVFHPIFPGGESA